MSNNFEWRDTFAQKPVMVVAGGGEELYRVAGGTSFESLPLGCFFSRKKPTSVSHAEWMLHIVSPGLLHPRTGDPDTRINRCIYVATYRVNPGVIMWRGKVKHGKQDMADFSAEQVYIEWPLIGKVELIKDIEPLRQDIFVGRGNDTMN